MINVDELRRMTPDERAELACALAALDGHPREDPTAGGAESPGPPAESGLPGNPRSRAIALVAVIGCCLALAAWIGVLAVTLPGTTARGAGGVRGSGSTWGC